MGSVLIDVAGLTVWPSAYVVLDEYIHAHACVPGEGAVCGRFRRFLRRRIVRWVLIAIG